LLASGAMRREAANLSGLPTPADAGRLERAGAPHAHVLLAVADDAARQRRETQLRNTGVQVSVAVTGFQAIVKASCHLPDIIFLDPSLGRAELGATRALLATCPVTAHIPVVSLKRGRAVPRDVVNALAGRAL
jgi:CheY-like chemotaxis protein